MSASRTPSRWWVVAAMSAASIALTIDLFGVNVALPTIATDLGLSENALQWVISIYYLALAAPLVAAGRLGDIFGRRKVLVVGAATAAVGSLLAALSTNGAMLVGARGVSGIGAAFVTALSLSIVSDAFPAARRGFAIGLWSGVGAVGAAAGPLVGGVVTETLGWRWLFAIDVPVALGAIVVTLLVVVESRDPSAGRVDVAGVVLVTGGLGMVAFGLLQGPNVGWGEPDVVISLAAGVLALAVFAVRELRARDPLVDMRWLARPPALGIGIIAMAGNAAFATVMLYLTLYFQGLRGDGPIETGLAFLAFTIPLGFGSPAAGALTNRVPAAWVMAGGMVLLAAGAGVLAFLGADTPVSLAYLGLALSGIGQAAVFNVTNIAEVSSVSLARTGMAAGVVSGIRQAGSLLGLAIAGAVFAAAGGVSLVTGTFAGGPADFVDGLRAAMLATAAWCAVGTFAVLCARPPAETVVSPTGSPAGTAARG